MNTQELEYRLIYSLIVAGKSANFTTAAMDRLGNPDLATVRKWKESGVLCDELKKARTGNYTKLSKALSELSEQEIDLETATPERLELIHGIGPKTSRFFIIWTRPAERYAALDVHVLRWLKEQGHNAPRSTPSGEKYRELEKIFISEADKRGMTPRELDYEIWSKGSGYKD